MNVPLAAFVVEASMSLFGCPLAIAMLVEIPQCSEHGIASVRMASASVQVVLGAAEKNWYSGLRNLVHFRMLRLQEAACVA